MASRFFGMNRNGYFLLFFDVLVFLAFLADLHPQDLHITLTSFRVKGSSAFCDILNYLSSNNMR